MNLTFKNTILFLVLIFSVISFQSCTEEGCTDPNAENFNADADEDDGSCTYARTKFVGSYGVGESCNGGTAVSLVGTIVESANATNEISITNEANGVTVTGIVSGNDVTIADTFTLGGQTINMVGSGTYSLVDGEEQLDMEYTFTDPAGGITTCISLWKKS